MSYDMDLTKNHDGKYLYKYYPFNQYSIQSLIHQEFWLGSPDMLNDPFEGDFIIKNVDKLFNKVNVDKLLKITNEESWDVRFLNDNYIIDSKQDEYLFLNKMYEYLNNEIKRKFGTTSFSKYCNSLKMWSHYADSHKGFIIIYNKEIIENTITNKKIRLIKVEYGNHPTIEISIVPNGFIITNDDLILTSKLKEWKSEKEYRLIMNMNYGYKRNRLVKYDNDAISGVIYGSNMTHQNLRTIDAILIEKIKNLPIYFAKKNPKRDNLIFKPFLH